MKYEVHIHYEGGWSFEVNAKNKEEAEEKAFAEFDEISAEELIDNLADAFVDDCWEIKG